MHVRLSRLLATLVAIGAFLALGTAPVGAQDDFDEEAARAEVEENLIGLFEQLAIAGDPDTDPADAEAAVDAAAQVIEGGDTEEVQAQIPGIAGLAAAAQLEIVIDEPPTFDESQTTAMYVFSALSFGNPSQLNEANGVHVLEDGTWKLSSQIWEAFVALGGDAQPDDIDGDGGGEGEAETDAAGGEDEALPETGVDSITLALLAAAVLGAGAILTSGSRRLRTTK